MPTFFNKDSLNVEQLSRYELACKDYEAIQKHNAEIQLQSMTTNQLQELKLQLKFNEDKEVQNYFLKMIKLNNPDSKSALFFRLLNNHKPLLYPPPCSYSYPWYSIIESNDSQEIHPDCNRISDFPVYEKNNIVIDQTSWEVIEKKSENEAILTYGMWKNLGFKWLLKQENILCENSTMRIVSHHNSDLTAITTLIDLEKEQRYKVMDDLKNLDLILKPETQEAYKLECQNKYGQGFGTGLFSGNNFWMGVFDTALTSGQNILNARREKNLPDYPTEEEIESLIAYKVQSYFDRGYSVDSKGNLHMLSWTLTRISPEILPNIYLEV